MFVLWSDFQCDDNISLADIFFIDTQGGNASADTESLCGSAWILRPESGAGIEVCASNNFRFCILSSFWCGNPLPYSLFFLLFHPAGSSSGAFVSREKLRRLTGWWKRLQLAIVTVIQGSSNPQVRAQRAYFWHNHTVLSWNRSSLPSLHEVMFVRLWAG